MNDYTQVRIRRDLLANITLQAELNKRSATKELEIILERVLNEQ